MKKCTVMKAKEKNPTVLKEPEYQTLIFTVVTSKIQLLTM